MAPALCLMESRKRTKTPFLHAAALDGETAQVGVRQEIDGLHVVGGCGWGRGGSGRIAVIAANFAAVVRCAVIGQAEVGRLGAPKW